VRFGDIIYVLDAFPKKSKKGIAASGHTTGLPRKAELTMANKRTEKTPPRSVTESIGNVLAELGLPNPEQNYVRPS
jgi:hypothetical protein